MRAVICGKMGKKYIGSEKLIGKKEFTAILSFSTGEADFYGGG